MINKRTYQEIHGRGQSQNEIDRRWLLFEQEQAIFNHQFSMMAFSPMGGGSNELGFQNGIYVNGFSSILGDSTSEDNLTNFISAKRIDDLTFYMGSLLDTSGNRTSMRSLVSQLHLGGQSRVFSNVTQAVNCIDTGNPGTEASYNNGSTPLERFDGFTQEWEFWNSSNPYGDFSDFLIDDIDIYNYCQANGMKYDIYVSRCEDYSGTYTDQQVADHLVQYHDQIHLVAYISEATYNLNKGLNSTRKTQLELIGNAAIGAGKVQKFNILWAANNNGGVNMRSWFVQNPNLNAYAGFESEYNAWESPAKEGLELIGQKIYAYSGIYDL